MLPPVRDPERQRSETRRLRRGGWLRQSDRMRQLRFRWMRHGRLRNVHQVKPVVAITAGDPAGIGPEIAATAAADSSVRTVCEPKIYGIPSGSQTAGIARGRISAAA